MYRLTTPKMYTRHYYIDEYYKLLIVFDSDGKWKFLPKLCISYLVSYAIQKPALMTCIFYIIIVGTVVFDRQLVRQPLYIVFFRRCCWKINYKILEKTYV